jgi:hypothetical protein
MCHKTVKVHLPASTPVACPQCGAAPTTFTYRRTKVRATAPANSVLPALYDPAVAQTVATVRSWQWECKPCNHLVRIESTRTRADGQITEGRFTLPVPVPVPNSLPDDDDGSDLPDVEIDPSIGNFFLP